MSFVEAPRLMTGAAGPGRIIPSELLEHLRAALELQFGAGPWLAGVLSPYVYLTARARAHPEADRLREAVSAALRQEPGLGGVWRISEVRAGQGDRDPVRRVLALGVAPDNTADLLFLAAPHHPLDLGEPAG